MFSDYVDLDREIKRLHECGYSEHYIAVEYVNTYLFGRYGLFR